MSEIESNKIIIRRLSSLKEINDNRTMIENFFGESRFSSYELSWGRVENLVKAALQAPDKMAIFIAEKGRQILGFAMCGISGFIGVVGLKLCNVEFLHVLPEYRKTFVGGKAMIGLLRGVERWAKSLSAIEINFSMDIPRIHTRTQSSIHGLRFQESSTNWIMKI